MTNVFLTTGAVAAALDVTIPTVKRWVKYGHLSAFKTAGGHYRICAEELERFRAAHEIPLRTDDVRILVVDDDATFGATMVETFGLDGRFKVELAEDGYEGLIKVGGFRPHLLVLDLHMPGLDGYHVCRKVKSDPAARDTRILAITGDTTPGVRERIVAAGADGFLEKPLTLGTLDAEIARLLGVAARTDARATS
ncbi:MAG: response regulator [Candidatus Rokubacteria bacterium]|nr:response regulator [Candidatus Rokubacteria bacterium]